MTIKTVDIMIIGAGPVGLMCAYLAKLCGMSTVIIDKSHGPLKVGRADAFNARTLQLLEIIDVFKELYPLGKTCNTSSIWQNGHFISRQSSWWENIQGCFHKHFLMLSQAHLENILDKKLFNVKRSTNILNIVLNNQGAISTLSNGESIQSRYVIGADGSQSFVRKHFQIKFDLVRPQMIWAVIDGVIDSDFKKVTEIIVFQNQTSDVAWIPREDNIDRFYVRMDKKDFTLDEVISKINLTINPYYLKFKKIIWFSQFSVKESVAEKFYVKDCVFLAGDACHIHSVNGGQGLNTGIADAFNLIWKLNMIINFSADKKILESYEIERKTVAQSVIETSGKLVRATKYSQYNTHAKDYVDIIAEHAGNITGMGIRYGNDKIIGTRLFDIEVFHEKIKTRLYSLLNYNYFTLFIFNDKKITLTLPPYIKLIQIFSNKHSNQYWTDSVIYLNQVILVRPDAYIESFVNLKSVKHA